ncbi:zinc-binding dehydrogenase [Metabacillus indicus]|uniref:zinc-binding dehydrogenase n=1 Tax=Metabacillus indicus TaxID=246786 RepID=UPI002491C0D9|nr:zinc-binding dehydrogenase [Metabacillus indicus]
MKALLLKEKGEWKDMQIGETEKPSPGRGEILIKVKAVGLNPVDYKTATGGNPLWSYPHILGLDAAGIVEETGEGVEHLQIGDRVVYHGDLTKKGGFAEYAVTTAHTVSIIPESVSFEDAAALPTAGYTAYQALYRKLRVTEGESILIHGGAGGVGGFAIQMAKRSGLTVYTTASASNHDFVKSLGADYAIDYNETDVTSEIMKLTGGNGVDTVLDTVSRVNATDSLDCLAFNGRIAYIAGAPDFTKVKPFTKAISYHEIALGAVHQSDNLKQQKDLAVMGDDMLLLLAERQLNSLLEQVIPLEEVPQALVQLSERHVKGKIVAKI